MPQGKQGPQEQQVALHGKSCKDAAALCCCLVQCMHAWSGATWPAQLRHQLHQPMSGRTNMPTILNLTLDNCCRSNRGKPTQSVPGQWKHIHLQQRKRVLQVQHAFLRGVCNHNCGVSCRSCLLRMLHRSQRVWRRLPVLRQDKRW